MDQKQWKKLLHENTLVKEGLKIVNDINVGKEVNSIFDRFNKVKTDKQLDKIKKEILSFKTGTYGTDDILEVIDDFGVINKSPATNEFIKLCKRVLKK